MAATHQHAAPVQTANGDERYRIVRRVTLIGSVIDFVLGVAKVVVGYLANSQALIADGIHSFSDLATDAMVLVAAKHGSRDADESHPYRHRAAGRGADRGCGGHRLGCG